MKIQGAVLKEQGVTFAVAIVKPHVLNSRIEANRLIGVLEPVFGGVPVVLMAQNARGVPTYFGRRDIVRFLTTVPLGAIPWKEFIVR